MRQRIVFCIIAVILTLSFVIGTTVAFFNDFQTASISLTAGRVEMLLGEITGDNLMPVMNVYVVNEGTIDADLWLENIYSQQNDAAESELNDLPEINEGGETESVTIEVIYKSETTCFILDDLDRHNAPQLLLKGMKPGSEALVTIKQNASLQPNVIQESLAEDSPPDGYYEKQSVPAPYIFEFILKSGPFTSLIGESVFTLTKFFEVYHEAAVTPGMLAADEPVDPSVPPSEAPLENSNEPTAVTTPPEPAADEPVDPSIPPSQAPLENFNEPTAVTTPPEPAADEPVDPSIPCEAPLENSNEPTAVITPPERTVEAVPSTPDLPEAGE